MTIFYRKNGLGGGSVGAAIGTRAELYTTMPAYYVSSVVGNNADGGITPEVGSGTWGPKASIYGATGAMATAIAASLDDFFIVLLSGHTETIATTVAATKNAVFVGMGSTSPIIQKSAGINGFDDNTAAFGTTMEFHNVQFGGGTTDSMIRLDEGGGLFMRDCYCDASGSGAGDGVVITLENASAKRLQFVDTRVVATTAGGLFIDDNATSVTNLVDMINVSMVGAPGALVHDVVQAGGSGMHRYEGLGLYRSAYIQVDNDHYGYIQIVEATGLGMGPGTSGSFISSTDGLGGTEGPDLVKRATFLQLTGTGGTGMIYYVHAGTGVNQTTGTWGKDRAKPWATLAYAVTQMGVGSTVVLMDGHTETLSSQLSVSVPLHIVGEGLDEDGEPTVVFTPARSSGAAFLFAANTSNGSTLRGVKFLGNTVSGTGSTVEVRGHYVRIEDTVIECNANMPRGGLEVANGYAPLNIWLRRVTVRSEATDSANLPGYGLMVTETNGGNLYFRTEDLVIDGGEHGWKSLGMKIRGNRLRMESIELRNGSDIEIDGSGYMFVTASNDAGHVRWASETGVVA